MYTLEFYSAIKKNKWVESESITLSEVTPSWKGKNWHHLFHRQNLADNIYIYVVVSVGIGYETRRKKTMRGEVRC